MLEKYVKELGDFIESCPTPFHAVRTIRTVLTNLGYTKLNEVDEWKLEPNKKYFVERDERSVIAFKIPEEAKRFLITASHNDSPSFRVKPDSYMQKGQYKVLNTEPYGGLLAYTWFDKPLGIAGRCMVKTSKGIESRLVDLAGHSFVIPSLAIHLNREANSNMSVNYQSDTLPLVGLTDTDTTLDKQLEKICCYEDNEKILGTDLFLYNKEKMTTCGLDNELILCPKLDDLGCAFSTLEAFLEADIKDSVDVCAIFDNEEVGSGSNHGAASTFLTDTLERISQAMNYDKYRMYASSMLVSADNAHAVHPEFMGKSDPTCNCQLNKGIVIKYSANLSYTTDGLSAAIFKDICDSVDVKYQEYTNRSDMRGGSTLGHIALEKLSIPSVDIGLAQLAMHSSNETAGAKDIQYMVKALKKFFESSININCGDITIK